MAQKRSLDKALSVGYPARVSRGMTLWPFILRSRSQTLRRINLNTPSFLNKLYGVPDCTADVFLEMPNANLPSGRASYQGISEGDVKDDDLKPRNKYKWCQDRQKYGKKSPKKIKSYHHVGILTTLSNILRKNKTSVMSTYVLRSKKGPAEVYKIDLTIWNHNLKCTDGIYILAPNRCIFHG